MIFVQGGHVTLFVKFLFIVQFKLISRFVFMYKFLHCSEIVYCTSTPPSCTRSVKQLKQYTCVIIYIFYPQITSMNLQIIIFTKIKNTGIKSLSIVFFHGILQCQYIFSSVCPICSHMMTASSHQLLVQQMYTQRRLHEGLRLLK